VYSITGYLREAETSFCMDDCSVYYLEEESGEFTSWVTQSDNLEMLEPYVNRFVEIQGEEIDCVECTALNVEFISMSDACEFPVECFADPCTVEDCFLYPDAECVANYCDGCWADFYINGELLDCSSNLECIDLTGIDFGACDMALGIGLMFGIALPFNFLSPFKAKNISEFWRCWHMTLSKFVREYLYNPISLLLTRYAIDKNFGRIGVFILSIFIPPMLAFICIGLWHGAGWNFILFRR